MQAKSAKTEAFNLYDVVRGKETRRLGTVHQVASHRNGRHQYGVRWGQSKRTTWPVSHADLELVKAALHCNLCDQMGGTHDPKCENAPCTGDHDRYSDPNGHPDEWPKAKDGLMGCAFCGEPAFYCETRGWYYHLSDGTDVHHVKLHSGRPHPVPVTINR